MTAARSYQDPCGIARALDLVGERWALLVVRDLLLGPKRFGQLRQGLGAVSPNVLSQRVRELEAAGVVQRRRLGPPTGAVVYELTARGRELEPALLALGRWGAATAVDTEAELTVDSLVIALKSMFDPGRAAGLRASYRLRLDVETFHLTVADGVLTAARTDDGSADVTIDTDPATLRAVIFGGRPLADAERSGALTVTGDHAAAATLVTLFPVTGGERDGARRCRR
ncbi:winged helix-turn-helix transcriptional regulator [Pseudonocardia acaciae]|uniref:winged helix-turn-helix transcriptional regulator n=1 Tax=Pseudonocardia acaciae TaxID=551276 RepID=UPI0006847E45|nr:winged helix-turn-helix transcriptional regulator [Pseudonocardia acaciae]